MDTEPVAIANAFNALLVAVAPLGTLFGLWEISEDQLAGITVAVVAVGGFISTVVARNRVSPV
jgi:hypothetical protein